MSQIEIIDVQCEIIKMQNQLIKKMAAVIGQENDFNAEISAIEALKERMEMHNE